MRLVFLSNVTAAFRAPPSSDHQCSDESIANCTVNANFLSSKILAFLMAARDSVMLAAPASKEAA
jgi:hypothetical protein